MSNIDKHAVQAVADLKAGYTLGHADVEIIQQMALDAVTLLDELEDAEHTAAVDHEAACSLVEENEEVKRKLAAADKRMAELESDKSRMMDALHAAVALNSAGISLNDFDECVLRMHEWGALPDYCIALYVDFIHGLVSENKLLDFGYVNDNGAFSLRQAEKRIAEQYGQKHLIGWRMADYTDETSDPELAKNWAAAIGVLPIFEGDVNTKLSAAGIGKGE